MKKIYIILILVLMPITEAYYLSNDDYKLYIGIVSGKSLENENYKSNINIYSLQKNLSNENYKLNLGYLFTKEIQEKGEEESPAGSLGRPTGARGGGCDVFADKYGVCYHIENLTCVGGCEEGYYCNASYRCNLGTLLTKTTTETLLETAKGKKAVIISLSIFVLVLIGLVSEEERRKYKKKKRKKEEETKRIIKEASTYV